MPIDQLPLPLSGTRWLEAFVSSDRARALYYGLTAFVEEMYDETSDPSEDLEFLNTELHSLETAGLLMLLPEMLHVQSEVSKRFQQKDITVRSCPFTCKHSAVSRFVQTSPQTQRNRRGEQG